MKRGLTFAALTFAAYVVLSGLVAVPASASSPAPTVRHGPRDAKRIALTFDDTFAPANSLPALRALRSLNSPATIFVTGMYANVYFDIDREIADGVRAGLFEVGDHSSTHPFLTKIPWSLMLDEIGAGSAAFTQLTGAPTVPLLRPPYGATDSTVAEAAGAKGMQYIVLWDVGADDWTGLPAETIRDDVLKNAQNGSIVLLHLAAEHTYEAIPAIVNGLRARGFELVTVSELLKDGRRFLDVTSGTPGSSAILRLANAGYMSGYDDSYFGPADPVTRAQFAKVSVLVTGLHTPEVEGAAEPAFLDVPPTFDIGGNVAPYPFDYVQEASAAGLVSGHTTAGGSVFLPHDNITRTQLAQILARMARSIKGYPESTGQSRALPADVPEHAAADVRMVMELGLMTGYSSERFDSWAPAQRSHVARVMSRYLDLPQYQEPPSTTTTTSPPPTSTTTTTAIPQPTTTTTTGPPPSTTTTRRMHPPTTSTS